MKPRDFIHHLRQDDIAAAIRAAERMTSGEIRVYVSHRRHDDPVATACRTFEKLGMTRTRERNGVLIFVAPRTRKFAVIGDFGIHERCGDVFWQQLVAEVSGDFRRSEFTPAILHAVQKAGELLAQYFPRRTDDQNELPDRVAYD